MKIKPECIEISIHNNISNSEIIELDNKKKCFICLDNDGNLIDFPCDNCKLYIHNKCFHDYIKKFENSKICSVCKNNLKEKKTKPKPKIKKYLCNISSNQCACLIFATSLLLYLGNQFLDFLNIKLNLKIASIFTYLINGILGSLIILLPFVISIYFFNKFCRSR
jgi:hypothetical protein